MSRLDILADIAEWVDGHIGTSSRAIFLYMAKGQKPFPFDAPHDQYDRQRCVVLLQAVPEWIERLSEIEELMICGTRYSGGLERQTVYPWNEQIPLIREQLKQHE